MAVFNSVSEEPGAAIRVYEVPTKVYIESMMLEYIARVEDGKDNTDWRILHF